MPAQSCSALLGTRREETVNGEYEDAPRLRTTRLCVLQCWIKSICKVK
jgi:hypothetical protein